MKSKRLATGRHPANEVGVVDLENNKLTGEIMVGDVVWVQFRSAWWPAQVIDEKTVNKISRPQKKFKCDVLLRLYGTYTYIYRDPTKYYSEFEKILQQNNGSYSEIFQKSLEQDLSQLKSSKSKRGVSESREKASDKTSKDEILKQHDLEMNGKVEGSKCATPKRESALKRQKTDSPGQDSPEKRPDSSVRRLKVMQNLGLAAPHGSPFRKKGAVSDI